jgi:hypothetical protein
MTKTLRAMLAVGLLCAGMSAHAQQPSTNINPQRHVNLAAAQAAMVQAYDSIVRAQEVTNGQMAGHAERAKQLLRDAANELNAAAVTLNDEGIVR